jgi:diguanylate cyclase (GGDEF)-like protein/PAS domain S-box-containing protein
MKRRIIFSLILVFLFSTLGGAFATLYFTNTNEKLVNLIKQHQIEDLRKLLIISIQKVQTDLYNTSSIHPGKNGLIAEDVAHLEQAAQKCTVCHHSIEISGRINRVRSLIDDYHKAVRSAYMASANAHHTKTMKSRAEAIGNEILTAAENMSAQASVHLRPISQDAEVKIRREGLLLVTILTLTLALAVLVAVHLTRSVIKPVDTLVKATRMISGGNLGYTITDKDHAEFGELESHFNAMSLSLQHGYRKFQQELVEHEKTEEALRESETFLNTIFDSILDPFCIIDRDYRIVRANEAYAQMRHRKLSELLGKTCYEVLRKQGSICHDCVVQKTFISGSPCAKEKKTYSRDGATAWSSIYTYPIMDGDGKVSHVIEYIQDITERKRDEKALRESEERYALAARGANDGLWDWDLRSNKIFFSHRWKAMLGYEEKDISDTPDEWFGLIHPDDRGEVEVKIAAHISGRDQHFESEYRIMHRDGAYRWVLNRGIAVRDGDHAYRVAGSQTDITSRKAAEEQLLHNAFHDALTGLPNRALFLDRLQHSITVSTRRANQRYAVLFLDMDRFKVVNDSLGHTVGDQLLIAMGQQLSECLRPGDTVARLGGDEFAVLLNNIGELKDAVDVAERIHSTLSAPLLVKGQELFASVSIGIAAGCDRYERPEQVLRDADIAMYQAKARGNACHEIFDPKMHANILDRLQLEADMRGALDHKEFIVFYQPIIDLTSHQLVGFEALVRWTHPKRGLIYPLEFIPMAEENGMINAIGEWILRESCRELRVLQERYPMEPPLKMSINISGKQFTQRDLAGKVSAIIRETGIDGHTLALEVTESMIMDNVEMAVETMKQLRSLGVQIHIDDFGTGYSSLSYLHRFPIDAIKIDRSFIKKLSADGKNKEIIMSILSLATSMNFDVIAEGVEMNHQLLNMQKMNCHYGQGFLFSVPMPPGEIDGWVKAEQLTHEQQSS